MYGNFLLSFQTEPNERKPLDDANKHPFPHLQFTIINHTFSLFWITTNENMNENRRKNQDNDDESAVPSAGCGILGEYPLITLVTFAVLGIGCGVGLSYWEDDGTTKADLIKWIGLLGDLFIRSLKCLVLPLIFVSVTIAVLDMMAIGRAGSVGWKTSKYIYGNLFMHPDWALTFSVVL